MYICVCVCAFRCVRITDTGLGYLSTMSSLRSLYLRWCCQVEHTYTHTHAPTYTHSAATVALQSIPCDLEFHFIDAPRVPIDHVEMGGGE